MLSAPGLLFLLMAATVRWNEEVKELKQLLALQAKYAAGIEEHAINYAIKLCSSRMDKLISTNKNCMQTLALCRYDIEECCYGF